MKKLLIALSLSLSLIYAGLAGAEEAAPAAAKPARKDCAELKQEIAAKIDANGVKAYRLDIVAADAVGSAKVVGRCDGGTQRIVYERGTVDSAQVAALR